MSVRRRSGTCYEVLGMRPNDHIGWVYDGPEDFVRLARDFLSDGVARGDRLMFVAEDPDPGVVAGIVDLVDQAPVQVASIAEVYGASGIVDATEQRATFAGVLAEAVAAGYRGIRVAADNTALVVDSQRLEAWMRWEAVADQFMSSNPVTGLCAFDRGQVDVDRLRHLATLHPLLSVTAPAPQFRLFFDDEALWVEGLLDRHAVDEIGQALDVLPVKTRLVVDLNVVSLLSNSTLTVLSKLGVDGCEVVLQGPRRAVERAMAGAGLAMDEIVVMTED